MREKTCHSCGLTKPVDQYYTNSNMADGYLSKSRPCVRADQDAYRAKNIEKIRECDRKRKWTDKHRAAVKARAERLRQTEEGRKYLNEVGNRWGYRNRHKTRAELRVKRAIEAGLLTPKPCERCGASADVQAHHEDYSRSLDVMWLCPKHHGERHRELNAERRRSKGEQNAA